MTFTQQTARQLAAEFNRPLCDVRWNDREHVWELYMAGGVWLPVEMVRDMKEEAGSMKTTSICNPAVKHLASVMLSTFVAALRPVHETYLAKPVEGAEAYLYSCFAIPLAAIEPEYNSVIREIIFPAAFCLARDVYAADGGQVYRCGVGGKVEDDKLVFLLWSTRGRTPTPEDGFNELLNVSVANFGLFSDWPATKLDLTAGREVEVTPSEIVVHQSVAEA